MAAAAAPMGSPCWVDLVSTDIPRARAFYEEVFGWTPGEASPEFGGYFMFEKGDAPVAGAAPRMQGDEGPSRWQVYLRSSDLSATTARVGPAAGEVVVPPMAVADLGSMAMVRDATGAYVGVWEPGAFSGFAPGVNEPGSPIWFELHASDFASAVSFYESVFDWHTQSIGDSDEFRYCVALDGANQFAGVFDASAYLSGDVGPHWEIYFAVSDVDESVEAIESLGGTLLMAAQDSPYGRLATVADPTGAVFRVMTR